MKKTVRVTKLLFTTPPLRQVFNEQVWEIVARVPKGKVVTYGQIAAMIPRPRGVGVKHFRAARARWVGGAMASCPSNLPWHRVINVQGKISVRSNNKHHLLQRQRLEDEGILFGAGGRIDLHVNRWRPRK
ncbi:MAG: MGMT family protein [Ignavibacteriales bacterium]|nr:MGMT family protein [Ignavibacteriales bacterium]